jgi:methionyl-tRNA synthetase
VLRAIDVLPGRLGRLIDSYQIKDAARELMTLPALGNRYFDYSAPWRTFAGDRPACDRTIGTCVRLLSALEILAYPFLPFTSRKLGQMLGLGKRRWDDAAQPAIPRELGPTEILFAKFDDSVIRAQSAKLGVSATGPAEPAEERAMVSFDEFKKLELRVARVKAAEPVPGATKLLKLLIDLGTEERQIVAGIARTYLPEELVGKSIVVVANLVPAVIRGVESNGMLLAAVCGETVVVVQPAGNVPPGTPVS